jgi:hypothetical protein
MLWEYRSGLLVHDDSFEGVAVTADGKILVAGARSTDQGMQDRWVAQFQAEGQMPVWSETSDSGDFESAFAVAVHDSAVFVAGATKPAGDRDAWIARLDLSGKIVWEDEVDSGFGDDFVASLAITPEGDLVAAGIMTLDGGLAATWTRRYAENGDVQWTQEIPVQAKTLYSVGPGVTVTAGQVVVGYYRAPEPGAFQAVLLAYPLGGGEPSWMYDLPTTGGVFGAASDPSGAVALSLQEIPDAFVVSRTSRTGEVQWSSKDCKGDLGKAVAVDSQGDIVAIGTGTGAVGKNIRLCKFTAEGKLRWGKDLDGGAGDDYGLAVAIMPDDRIVSAGNMWAGGEGRSDAWLAVFTP